jgi:hypothetical protein
MAWAALPMRGATRLGEPPLTARPKLQMTSFAKCGLSLTDTLWRDFSPGSLRGSYLPYFSKNRTSLRPRTSALVIWHSHMVATLHPAVRSCRTFFLSRRLLPSIFTNQYSTFDFGRCPPLQAQWPCQKQPCTKITLRLPAKTKSGFPGSPR